MGIGRSMEQLNEMDSIKSHRRLSPVKKMEDNDNESESGHQEPDLFSNGVNSTLIKKCLDVFTRNIDRMDKKNKQFYQNILT